MNYLPAGAVPWLHDFARWLGTWIHRPFYRIRVLRRSRVPRSGPVVLVANGFGAGRTLTVELQRPDGTRETYRMRTRTRPGFVKDGLVGPIFVPRGSSPFSRFTGAEPFHTRPTFWRMNETPIAVISGASRGAWRRGR